MRSDRFSLAAQAIIAMTLGFLLLLSAMPAQRPAGNTWRQTRPATAEEIRVHDLLAQQESILDAIRAASVGR
jgi:hypothetical protein